MANDSKVVLDVKGLEQLIRDEPEIVGRWLDAEAEAMVTDIKLSMNTSPAGETYTRGSITHTASQPGYPPNIDTAALINSIRWERDGLLTRNIMDGVAHGIMMEDGTETILPRPFMAPAFARESKAIGQSARDNLGLDKL